MTERELLIMIYGILSSAPEATLEQQKFTILTVSMSKTIMVKIEEILNDW